MRETIKFSMLKRMPAFIQRRYMTTHASSEIDDSGEIELTMLDRFVAYGDLAVDVGANMGSFTLALSRLTDRVVAIEANPDLAQLLRKMNLKGVDVVNVALGAAAGKATLSIPDGNLDEATLRDALLPDNVRGVTVDMKPLDALGLDGAAFIKIDVEGFEEQVLAGAQATIAASLPILFIEIEERHNPGALGRIDAMLSAKGYQGYFFHHGSWQPLAGFDPALHQDQHALHVEGPFRRREIDYVNNFVFMQPATAAKALN